MLVDEYQYQPIPLTMPGGKPCLCKPPWYLLLPSLSSEALSLPRLFRRAVSLQISRSPVAVAVCVEARPIPLWRNSYREDKHDQARFGCIDAAIRTYQECYSCCKNPKRHKKAASQRVGLLLQVIWSQLVQTHLKRELQLSLLSI